MDIETLLQSNISKELAFSDAEYQHRLKRVRAAMVAAKLDILLVHNLPNVCYLTGYQNTMADWYICLVIPDDGDIQLQICDPGLAVLNTRVANLHYVRWDKMSSAADQLIELLKTQRPQKARIGIEPRRPGLNSYTHQRLLEAFPQAEFVDADDLVAHERSIKSPAEIQCMRQAGRISVVGMEAAVAAVATGCTENDIAAAATSAMIKAGSEFFSIDPFVRAGQRSSIVHATYKRNFVKCGDSIIIEVGAVYQRYTSPIAGTAVLGPAPKRLQQMTDIALRAIDLLLENVRPGRSMDEVARAVSKGLDDLEPDMEISERHAYSVGLGFPPSWTENSVWIAEGYKNILQPGMVFHAIRTIRIIGAMSVSFSDTFLVTNTGCEVITPHKRDLIVV